MSVIDLYNDIQKFGVKHQKKHGQNPTKLKELDAILLDATSEFVGEWHPEVLEGGDLYRTITDKVLDLPETMCSGRGNETVIYKNHLIIETFRIPLTYEPTLGQLLRIGMYTGLLNSSLRQEDFPDGIVRTYKTLDLSSISNFMKKDIYSSWDLGTLPTTIAERLHVHNKSK
jgi:hypothetical protein